MAVFLQPTTVFDRPTMVTTTSVGVLSYTIHPNSRGFACVRRQSFWDSELVHLREALARLVGDVKRPADDAASLEWRWSVV